jgi:hypothetical protein
MSLFFGDLRIKAALTLGLEDITKNPWLLNDILGDTVANPYLRKLYGSQIESCSQWLANNRINIVMSERDDKLEFPAIVIDIGTSNEKPDMKRLADLTTEKIHLSPSEVNKPIPYVIKPTSGSYDPTLGVFTFTSAQTLNLVSPGMALVDPTTGSAYVVQSVVSSTQVQLLTGLSLNATLYGVIPEYRYFEARIGGTFFQESYKVSCKAMDQNTLLWLHAIATYSLLRYRQSLLEADGFAESVVKSGKMYPDPDYSDAGQVIWARDITLEGQVENRWIEQPHRYVEDIVFPGGLKILSNLTDTFENPDTVNWQTLQDIAYENE